MEPQGRDRRRKGLVNKFRRAFYGLVLLTHAPYAAAADELAYLGKQKQISDAGAAKAIARTRAETRMFYDPVAAGAMDLAADGELVPARLVNELLDLSAPALDRMLVTVVTNDLRMIRNGVGIDLDVPEIGHFHMNLYQRSRPKGPQKRWKLTLADDEAEQADPEGPVWSLGASLDEERHGGSRRITVVPQLLVDLDRLTGSAHHGEAVVMYGGWTSARKGKPSGDPVFQVQFKWRF